MKVSFKRQYTYIYIYFFGLNHNMVLLNAMDEEIAFRPDLNNIALLGFSTSSFILAFFFFLNGSGLGKRCKYRRTYC